MLALAFGISCLLASLAATSVELMGQQSLESCLRRSIEKVVTPDDPTYSEAKQCINRRADIAPSPLVVVRVRDESEVQAVVRCAAASGKQVCARAGGHGFDNDAGCSDGIVIDLQDLGSFTLDPSTNTTSFGTGHVLGNLYYKLAPHGLLVSGGPINSVGAAGLILGCGRGLVTQFYGLACDSLLAVRYVDARGVVQVADTSTNGDMFWMAAGSGGNFPGIVTEITMQAHTMPTEVYTFHCTWQSHEAKLVIHSWLALGEKFVDPQRKMFTSLQMWNRPAVVEVSLLCFDCNDHEKQWLLEQAEVIAVQTTTRGCSTKSRTWLEHLLYESGVDVPGVVTPPTIEALRDRTQGWGPQLGPIGYDSSKNGGHMGYEWSASDALLDDVLRMVHVDTPQEEYSVMVEWYLTGGPKVEAVDPMATAYGHRDSKWVLHYKHQWKASAGSAHMARMMEHHVSMSKAIDQHLRCSNFYNYLDNDMPCAATNGDWLSAHFSDPERMRAIKDRADPLGVFRSRLVPTSTTTLTTTSTTTAITTTDTVDHSAACSAHPKCAGLWGACCPTLAGVHLGCCGPMSVTTTMSTTNFATTRTTTTNQEATTSMATTRAATSTTITTEVRSAACSTHPQCAGLWGDCCPTSIGVHLGCCEQVRRLRGLAVPVAKSG